MGQAVGKRSGVGVSLVCGGCKRGWAIGLEPRKLGLGGGFWASCSCLGLRESFLMDFLFNSDNSGCSGTVGTNTNILNKIRVFETATQYSVQVFRIRDSGIRFYAQRDSKSIAKS